MVPVPPTGPEKTVIVGLANVTITRAYSCVSVASYWRTRASSGKAAQLADAPIVMVHVPAMLVVGVAIGNKTKFSTFPLVNSLCLVWDSKPIDDTFTVSGAPLEACCPWASVPVHPLKT